MMQSRGYSTKRYPTLQSAYHNYPTKLQNASYDVHLINLVKKQHPDDTHKFHEIIQSGISPNPCNTYGESLVHMVCRRGNSHLLQIMLESGCSVQVSDDYGRTPLHDACWAAEPAFETVTLLLDHDTTLIQMLDCRGNLPLSYIRKDHWSQWIDFLHQKKDIYWPSFLTNDDDDNVENTSDDRQSFVSTVSEFVDQYPNTRPIRDPKNALPLDLANQVASGRLKPQEAIRLHHQRKWIGMGKVVDVPHPFDEASEEVDTDDDYHDDAASTESSTSDHDDDTESDEEDIDDDIDDDELEELIDAISLHLQSTSSSVTG
jgi:Ankyrin repeats (3 copies)